jgi:hypothetical protein
LMISSRAGRNKSSWRSSRGWLMAAPLTANLAVEGITNRPNPESRNARKQQPTNGFLAKSNTCSGQITTMVQSLPNSSRATSEICLEPAGSHERSFQRLVGSVSATGHGQSLSPNTRTCLQSIITAGQGETCSGPNFGQTVRRAIRAHWVFRPCPS